MSQLAASPIESLAPELKVDSIASGVLFMLATNVLQRGIGFVRNLSFCYFLAERDLGAWALASSFFILAAPLAVLGLPGSLGRFVEFYRVRGQLAGYLRRVAKGSAFGTAFLCFGLIAFASPVSQLILGESQSVATMFLVAMTLVCVIIFNFLTELACGLRQPRLASSMQLVNSLSFTALSLTWLAYSNDWRGVMVAFGLASLLGIFPAWFGLRNRCGVAFTEDVPLRSSALWQRIVPFAVSVWWMNLLSNLFDVVDRYMILHLAGDSIESGQALVGQYHSSRVLPILLLSLGTMLSGMLLPYLSADWESKAIGRVQRMLRLSLLTSSLGFWGLSLAGMLVAPFLFDVLLNHRYGEGLAIMPMALVHCSLVSITLIVQNYFWCVERGRYVSFMIAVGLVLNVALNWILVPQYGTWGAMFATLISGITILLMTVARMAREKVHLGWAYVVISLLPITLAIDTRLSFVVFMIAIVVTYRSPWLLSSEDRSMLDAEIRKRIDPFINRIKQYGCEGSIR